MPYVRKVNRRPQDKPCGLFYFLQRHPWEKGSCHPLCQGQPQFWYQSKVLSFEVDASLDFSKDRIIDPVDPDKHSFVVDLFEDRLRHKRKNSITCKLAPVFKG